MAETAKWYVIHTYSGYENKVKNDIENIAETRNLRDEIVEVQIPTRIETEIKENNETKEHEVKAFPGYVLLKMKCTDETWHLIKEVRGVTGFVGAGGEPTPLTEQELETIGINLQDTIRVNYEVGDTVQIVGTNMDGMTGIVSRIDFDEGTVEVNVSMFGRELPVSLKLGQVSRQD